MALNCGIHYKTIAVISSDLKLSDWFWRDFWNTQKIGLNFDGELYGTGFTLPKLIEAGFTAPDKEGSNCCWGNAGEIFYRTFRRLRGGGQKLAAVRLLRYCSHIFYQEGDMETYTKITTLQCFSVGKHNKFCMSSYA